MDKRKHCNIKHHPSVLDGKAGFMGWVSPFLGRGGGGGLLYLKRDMCANVHKNKEKFVLVLRFQLENKEPVLVPTRLL